MKFWLYQNNDTTGPFSAEELQGRLHDGELSPEDKICPMGENDWEPLSSIAAPPPPPTDELTPPPPPTGEELPPTPAALPPTPAARRRSLTLAVVAAAVVVAGIAGTLVYLLNDPSRPLPKTASYVPKDSAFVLTTHVGDLLEKGNVSDLLSKGVLEEMGMPRQIRKKIEDLFEDPAQFGMDTKEPVYFSMQPGPDNSEYPVYCITVPVTNSKDFLDGMEDLVTVEGRPDKMLMAVIDDLRKSSVVTPENEIGFGINDDVFVIVIQDIPYFKREGRDQDAMAKIAKKVLKGDGGLATANKSFTEHQTALFDVGTWVNLGSLAGMVPAKELEREFGQLGDLSKLKSFQLTGSIHFGQGEITGDMAMYYDEKLLGDWGGGGLDSELLDAMPEDTMMAISQSMNMEVVKQWFNDRPGIKKDMEEALQSGIGMSLDEALGALKGDLVLALTDLNMVRSPWGGPSPQPSFIFGATITDKNKVEKMLAEPMRELERDEDAPARMVMHDNAFFVCSPDNESDLEKNGKVDNPVTGEKRSLLANNDTGFFLDYQNMEKVLSRMSGDDEEAAIVLDAVGDLGLVTLTWNAEAGAQKIQGRIRMPKEDENSLKQIVDSTFRAAVSANRRMRGRYGETPNWDEGGGEDWGEPDTATTKAQEMDMENEATWKKSSPAPSHNHGGFKTDSKSKTSPKRGGFDEPRFPPSFGEKENEKGFAPKEESPDSSNFTPAPGFDRGSTSSNGGFPKETDEATGFATKATDNADPEAHDHGAHEGPWLTSLPTALAQAKSQGKLVLIDFTGSDWCPPCIMLHDKVLTQKPFLDYARQNLVLVMLDFPRQKLQKTGLTRANQALAKKYNVNGFPTLILLDGNGKELAREVGLAHQNPTQMIAWLKAKGRGHNHGHSHGDAHGDDAAGGDAHGETLPVKADDPEELIPVVDAADELAANRSVVVNPKGSQGLRYVLAEIYMQRSEPKDKKFKERAGKKTKQLQEIVTSELQSKTVEELQQPATKESIRQNLQKQFNNVLKTPSSPAPVGKIIISKWIMQ